MTGNMIKGKGFRGALRYNLEKVDKGVAEVLAHSLVEVSEKTIMKEVQMIKALRPNLQKFFYHTSINFPPTEDLSNERMKEIGLDYLKASGFEQHQFIMFRHRDADHPHLHILVNRIGYDGKVMSDSNDFARCETILRELEKKYNLTEVRSSRQAKERALTKNELEMMKRTNQPSAKTALQVLIKQALESRSRLSTQEFIQKLEDRGINVLFNQASTGYVSGISYSYDGVTITGAKLGNDFKWTTIKNNIDYEQERDREAIHQANDRTRTIQTSYGRISTSRTSKGNTGISQQRTRELPSELSNDTAYPRDSIQKPGQPVKEFAPSSGRPRKVSRHGKSERHSKSTAPNLANILESGIGRLLFSAPHVTNHGPGVVPPLGNESKKSKKKKKRRGPRM
jgi:hypothetical protein